MATRAIIFAFILAACLNLILTEDADDDYQDENDVRAGRAYSLTSCNYGEQIGYSCLSCHRALHCYFGGVAILVDCYGAFRYCRDGRCSRKQDVKCLEGNKITTSAPEIMNVTTHDGDAPEIAADPVAPWFASESSADNV